MKVWWMRTDALDYRTEKFGNIRKLYMIERPEGGFQSKQQVKDLFDEAYEKSLTEKRSLPEGFLLMMATHPDFSQLMMGVASV